MQASSCFWCRRDAKIKHIFEAAKRDRPNREPLEIEIETNQGDQRTGAGRLAVGNHCDAINTAKFE